MTAEVKPRMAPKPNVYVNTDPFWQAAQKGELVIQYCKDSGKYQHYPRPVSIYTGKRNLEWRKVSGKGTIYAHTMIRIPVRVLMAVCHCRSRPSNWTRAFA